MIEGKFITTRREEKCLSPTTSTLINGEDNFIPEMTLGRGGKTKLISSWFAGRGWGVLKAPAGGYTDVFRSRASNTGVGQEMEVTSSEKI